MTTPVASELAFLDTNILVYAFVETAEQHTPARALLDQAIDSNQAIFCISPQILAEFYAVITNRRQEPPRTPAEAVGAIKQILLLPGITVLPIPTDVMQTCVQLLQEHPVTGTRIFDLQIIATMLGNGVRRIYTYDRPMAQFSEIEVLLPEGSHQLRS